MKRLLFVSIAFPPKKDPEGIQTARYFKYLSQNENLTIDVITGKPPVRNMPLDNSLAKYDTGFRTKLEIEIKENRYWNFLRKNLDFYFKPDTKWTFYENVVLYVKKHSLDVPDVIYSRSYPMSSTYAAYFLATKLQRPWIMHLSDPWLLSPLHVHRKKEYQYIQKWERIFVEKASCVTLTSELTVQKYQKAYPSYANKFHFLPNVYDDDDVSSQSQKFLGDKIRIVYTGGIVGNRNPLPIFRALEMLTQKERDCFDFIFVGDADRSNRKLMKNCKHSCVNYLGLKSLEESMLFQKSADILLLVDNEFDHADDAVYFPSKLLDYMIHGKQILAITTLNGTTDQVMKSLGLSYCYGHSQVKEIAVFLRKCIGQLNNENKDFFMAKTDTQKYSASENANHLYSLIQKHA